MPAVLVVVGLAVGLSYIGMGSEARTRFWTKGITGLWNKNK